MLGTHRHPSITYYDSKSEFQPEEFIVATPEVRMKENPFIHALRAVAYFAGALILIGLVIGFLDPGPLTGALLPIGLGLWWLVGFLGRRCDPSAAL